MSLTFLSSPELPKAVGPYSHGTKSGNLIMTSGQIAIDPNTGKMVKEIKAATKMVLQSLLSVVVAGGGKLETIARVDVYLKNLNDFDAFNEAYSDFFGSHKPARVTTEAGNLAEGATIEVAVTAFTA